MRTTFVFGAGASRDAGYPFAKDMGRGLLNWMEQAESEGLCDFSWAASVLRETFAEEDMETLLDRIDAVTCLFRSPSPEESRLAAEISKAHRALVHGLRRWFEEIDHASSRSSYRQLSREVMKSGDTVLTFNYDVSLDRELKAAGLWEAGDGYGFRVESLPAVSKVRLLKLHGSINWRALLFGGEHSGAINPLDRSLGRRPVLFDYDLRTLGYEHEVDNFLPPNCEVAAIDSLILPVREKEFFFRTSFGDEWTSLWDSLWSDAAESLRSSDRIIICGYSVPAIDS